MVELAQKEQELFNKVSKGDLSTLQKMMPDIKKEAIKTGDLSLAQVIQSERISSSMNQNHGLSKDQVGSMAMIREVKENREVKETGKNLLNVYDSIYGLGYYLGTVDKDTANKNTANTNLEFNFNPGKNLYLMASPFLTGRLASLMAKYSKESKDAVAQKEKVDKQIYKNMDFYVNRLMQNTYSMLSPMLLKTISERAIEETFRKDMDEWKAKMAVAEKEGNKIEAKKAKNELEFLMRLADPESLPHIYLQLIAQGIMVPPKHMKLKLNDIPEPGKLMLAVKDIKKGLKTVLPPFIKYIRSNEKKIEKDLTGAMEKFRQA